MNTVYNGIISLKINDHTIKNINELSPVCFMCWLPENMSNISEKLDPV